MFRYWKYVLKEKLTEFAQLLDMTCEKIRKAVKNAQVLGFRNWENRIAINYYGKDFPWLLLCTIQDLLIIHQEATLPNSILPLQFFLFLSMSDFIMPMFKTFK